MKKANLTREQTKLIALLPGYEVKMVARIATLFNPAGYPLATGSGEVTKSLRALTGRYDFVSPHTPKKHLADIKGVTLELNLK